jgi:uncharacterized protein involved in exopolysaccharide biosynthesis
MTDIRRQPLVAEPSRYPDADSARGPAGVESITVRESIDALAALIMHRRMLVFGMGVAFATATLIYTLVKPRDYTASGSFMSQNSSRQSSLSGLASQLGVAVPGEMGGDSPQFYVDLVSSRAILDSVVSVPYSIAGARGTRRVSLESVFDAKGDTPAQRRAYVIRKLREHMNVTVGKQTGVVSLSVTTPIPVLSQQVVIRILEAVNSFNLNKRQSRASAERRFAEARLGEARATLLAYETRLQAFLQENRQYNSAPRLVFENQRLMRQVADQQQLVSVLSQAYEQAKLDEVRNTPVITVLDGAEVPPAPDPRGIVTKMLFAVLLGIVTGGVVAWWRDGTRRDVAAGDGAV